MPLLRNFSDALRAVPLMNLQRASARTQGGAKPQRPRIQDVHAGPGRDVVHVNRGRQAYLWAQVQGDGLLRGQARRHVHGALWQPYGWQFGKLVSSRAWHGLGGMAA